jgi:hypothetical protein
MDFMIYKEKVHSIRQIFFYIPRFFGTVKLKNMGERKQLTNAGFTCYFGSATRYTTHVSSTISTTLLSDPLLL